jgi:hypothetical protein
VSSSQESTHPPGSGVVLAAEGGAVSAAGNRISRRPGAAAQTRETSASAVDQLAATVLSTGSRPVAAYTIATLAGRDSRTGFQAATPPGLGARLSWQSAGCPCCCDALSAVIVVGNPLIPAGAQAALPGAVSSGDRRWHPACGPGRMWPVRHLGLAPVTQGQNPPAVSRRQVPWKQ